MTSSRKQFMMCDFLIFHKFLALETILNIKIHLKNVRFPLPGTTMYYPVPELFEIHRFVNSITYLEWYPKLSFGMY